MNTTKTACKFCGGTRGKLYGAAEMFNPKIEGKAHMKCWNESNKRKPQNEPNTGLPR